jgi:putative component of toxin-antitoxin plasmid stabilization module
VSVRSEIGSTTWIPSPRPRSRWLWGESSKGNLSGVKGVGRGVLEYRIDFGPGYRIYFGRDGHVLVILLGGGTKKRQQQDIDRAAMRWVDYKHRKRMP